MRTAVVLFAVAACGWDKRPSEDETQTPPPSNNPIDVAIWPRMVASGLTELPKASTDELCHRMALDLIGVVPSADERATICDGKTAEQIARGFMALPRFRATERRFWIRRIGADPTALMADHIRDADRLYDSAADGVLGYDELVVRLLAHPVMTINRPVAAGSDVKPTIQHIFRTFLGRSASAAEVLDYANLLRPWQRRFEDRYDLGYGYYVHPAALDPRACRDPLLGSAACTSVLLGAPTTIDPPIAPRVPPGYSQTSGALFYYELVQGTMPDAIQIELEKPGRLFVARGELWDAAADFALARLLGWWRSSANEPETVLPEVQRALAVWFRAQPRRDLRELYVTIMTSLLYTTSAEYDGDDRPPWATGPTKLLEPEQLLDSAARALDRDLGFCDPHTDEPVGRNFYWPSRLREPTTTVDGELYRDLAQQLGGCLGAIAAPKSPGLPALLAHIDLAKAVCTAPPIGDATFTGVADELFARFLTRAPSDEERTSLATAATACTTDPSCSDARGYARELCGALLRSSTFLYY